MLINVNTVILRHNGESSLSQVVDQPTTALAAAWVLADLDMLMQEEGDNASASIRVFAKPLKQPRSE